jgi:hypothetical protein
VGSSGKKNAVQVSTKLFTLDVDESENNIFDGKFILQLISPLVKGIFRQYEQSLFLSYCRLS